MTVSNIQVRSGIKGKHFTKMQFSDGTGGCDGCLNWKGMGAEVPNVFDEAEYYTWTPANKTDNNRLGDIVETLEKIYTNIDWPFEVTTQTIRNQISRICFLRRQACQPVSSSWASLGQTFGSLLALWPWRGHWRGPTGPVTWTTGPGNRFGMRGHSLNDEKTFLRSHCWKEGTLVRSN